MAVHAAEVSDEGGAAVAGHLDWKTRRGLLFHWQSMKNWYPIATYEAVVHRILGRYMGLQIPASAGPGCYSPAWAPEPVPELLGPGRAGCGQMVRRWSGW